MLAVYGGVAPKMAEEAHAKVIDRVRALMLFLLHFDMACQSVDFSISQHASHVLESLYLCFMT